MMLKPGSRRRVLVEIGGVALLYYATGWLGRLAAPPPGIATVVWPPSGIALAALLIFGGRIWPGIWLGAFLANNWAAFHYAGAHQVFSFLTTGVGIDTGSLLQALLGAWMVEKAIGERNPFDRLRDSVAFIAIALAMCLVGCTTGVLSLYSGGFIVPAEVPARWLRWWIGDTGGVLVVAPLILTIRYSGWPTWTRSRVMEASLVFGASILLAVGLFVVWHPPADQRYPADLLLLPLIAWVAYRFSQREVAVLVVLILAIAVNGTLHGRGPYHDHPIWRSLPVLQGFIGILSILAITIGAVITERKRAGKALEESERWLLESQRISRTGSYVLDVRTGAWKTSVVLDEILGLDPEYPRTRDGWGALIHPEDAPEELEQLARVIAEGGSFQREYRIVRPHDGEVRRVQCNGEMTVSTRRSTPKLAGTILDVTERRNIEAQLMQALKMESIGRLAGGVAHDFNNLLTVINGYGDLVLNRIHEEDPVFPHLREMRRAGGRAAELTAQLLAFSRRQVLQPKVLSLNDIVRDSEKLLRRVIGEEIELQCQLQPDLQMVEADPGQLHQVIVNLAVNARDAMPGGGKLMIETEDSADGVTLRVRDTGHGMDQPTLERVFEPFFTTKAMGKGTGLGLATVYGIVRQSSGDISVESETGQGATFTIRFPVSMRAPEAEQPQAVPAGGSATVLLVEDEEGVRRLLATILQHRGYRVLEAEGGDDAMRLFEAETAGVDLLITDIVMPRMRGPELAAQMRQRRPELTVLFISGYTDPQVTDQAFAEGAHFLQKPFAADTLVRTVGEILGQRANRGA